MAVIVAVVVLVGALCVLNLLLTLGVIRRLREHTDLIAESTSPPPGMPTLPVGRQVADYTATTTDGEPVSRDDLSGDTLVAFLTPTCKPCQEQMPELAKVAQVWAGGRDHVLVVIIGDSGEAAKYVKTLAPVARVVVEESLDSPITTAFEVAAFPLFGLVDGIGKVLRSTLTPTGLQMMDATIA